MIKTKSTTCSTLFLVLFCVSNNCIAQLSPLTIGAIPAGDSIIIRYSVVINNPLPVGVTQISNQGTVSGSNFSNVVTDDPDSGPANDPTITVLNLVSLPVFIAELKAFRKDAAIELNWNVLTETDIIGYDIEKSTDGSTFLKAGYLTAFNNPSGTAEYKWLDVVPYIGNNYYRLKILELNGITKYTSIVKVLFGNGAPAVNIYPNPVQNKVITLQFTGMEKGVYSLLFTNLHGQTVYQKTISHSGGNAAHVINMPGQIQGGVYYLKTTNGAVSFTTKIIVSN
jgi:Secretion system C-terminal sorting domain